jgi:hypothetical protein
MECLPLNQSANQEYCNSVSECTQDATLGSVVAEAYGDLVTRCSLVDPGSWSCECYVSSTPYTLEVAGDLGWDVCSEANEICSSELELIGTADGPYSGVGGYRGY